MAAINMPQVGQDLETAVITEWKVQVGDTVEVGDVIALVESDKAVFEVEAFEAGTITKLLYEAGDEGKVFEPMAYVEEQGEGKKEKEQSAAGSQQTEQKQTADSGSRTAGFRVFASPSARRLARQHDVDLARLAGSGPNGRIIKEDILKAIELSAISSQPSAKSEQLIANSEQPMANSQQQNVQSSPPILNDRDQVIPFSKIRQTIADRLTLSATTIPHFYLQIDVDMTAALAWRDSYNVTAAEKISINDMIIRAVARSLAKCPSMNAHVESDKLILKKDINIGVAVSVDDGLIVPVIPKADALSLEEIHVAAQKAAQGAKSGIMKMTDPGTFTISNLGMFGISQFFPIINPPEAGILGVGAVEKQFVPGPHNSFAIRDKLKLTLACDHRAIDGVEAARFLTLLKTNLEQ